MSRADASRDEMATCILALAGTDGPAKAANGKVARLTGLSVQTIERLRWRKIARVPADVADAIREAMLAHVEQQEQRARHEASLLRARLARFEDLGCADAAATRDRLRGGGEAHRTVDL